MSTASERHSYIGVFDSGVGGLTVLKALKRAAPGSSFLYLGDTARVPYGIKSPETVQRYTREALHFFLQFPLKAMVVACNTASAVALPVLLEEYRGLPLFGVIEPAVREALRSTLRGEIAVLATEATIRSRAYEKALLRSGEPLKIHSLACPLFVPLVEEGLTQGKVAETVIAHYLHPLKETRVDTVILGCTHYPLLREAIQNYLGEEVKIIDSAEPLARELSFLLVEEGTGETLYFTSDDPERFRRLGSLFLGEPVEEVELVTLDLYTPHIAHALAPR